MTTEQRLDNGTQTIAMHDIFTIPCRCGALLTWDIRTVDDNGEEHNFADCNQCSMSYMAWEATIKVEGTDRSTL